ncbi:MAG: hypothetical protein IT186_17755 [Acidobacteria bacterium]|nr:hypothetical protein [Acidobacteriota bacterium]
MHSSGEFKHHETKKGAGGSAHPDPNRGRRPQHPPRRTVPDCLIAVNRSRTRRRSGGSNWYAYVNNDPVNFVDPWGLSPSDAGSASAGVAQDPTPRILQTDPRIGVWQNGKNVMASNGCFFRADLGVVESEIERPMAAGEINVIRALTQASGLVNPDMSVVEGRAADVVNAAFQYLGVAKTASVVAYGPYSGPADASLIIGLTVNDNPHTRQGNAQGKEVWDPYGPQKIQFAAGAEALNYVFFEIEDN